MLSGAGRLEFGEEPAPLILVVEDEPIVRLSIADYLRDVGYRVFEAGNAEEATAMLMAGEPIRVVFSDVGLPGEMGGLSLYVWIRSNFPEVQVILTSAQPPVTTRLSAPQPVVFIPKPYDGREVAEYISSLLGTAAAQGRR
jgi:CheY-like chemotaxis protein